MSEQTFPLPDVGEGLTEAEIVNWLVAVGDTVELNQVICEIETAKSLVELPSPFAGVVTGLLAEVGQTVPVGQGILRIRTDATAGADAGAAPSGDPRDESADRASEALKSQLLGATGASDRLPEDEGGAVLVGYGTVAPAKSRRTAAQAGARGARSSVTSSREPQPASNIIAKPPIRKLAKDLGVDLAEVVGTGHAGEIVREDVLRETAGDGLFREASRPQQLDQREQRFAVKGVRKLIAENMVASAFTAPHVTVFVDVDATRTMEYVKRLKASSEFEGVKVSPLLIFAKALMWAVRRNPEVNARWT
ncbi:MAG: 2-oxo acid dehydrogenase subunit E2, partial [Microbacteriaceae bacterium]|nr:2-oxo acid dehydrogenase subunit E2 [Microbacteriaceae bacterium]